MQPAPDKEGAHVGVIADPSSAAAAVCGACHDSVVDAFAGSLHDALTGEHNAIQTRSGHPVEDEADWSDGFGAACEGCHATCGECHVSRPRSVGGGLVSGHVFDRTPSMINQCTACHGSRIGEEFRGTHRDEIDGYKGDAHYLAGYRCEFCHGAAEIHGAKADHRLAVESAPQCVDCHSGLERANTWHSFHFEALSCQVCHAQDYKNCESCHVGSGLEKPSWLGFKIGINPLPAERTATYVTLRHVPVAPDTYDAWSGGSPLSAFDAAPTWKYASPHNIQRWTSRTAVASGEACSAACHETPATEDGWFLRQVDLDARPDEADANAHLIVPDSAPTEWE